MKLGGLKLGGIFTLTCRDKKTGKIKWVEKTPNIVTNEGLDHILNVQFHGTTPVSPWYLALFEDDHTPVAANTYAVPGYTESTAYDEATRQEYEEGAASSQSITNSANRGVFTISATKSIYGAALVSLSAKGNTAGAGILFAAGKFTNSKNVNDNDILELAYQLTSADDGV